MSWNPRSRLVLATAVMILAIAVDVRFYCIAAEARPRKTVAASATIYFAAMAVAGYSLLQLVRISGELTGSRIRELRDSRRRA